MIRPDREFVPKGRLKPIERIPAAAAMAMHTHQLVLFPVTHTRPDAGIDRSVTAPAPGRPHMAKLLDELVPMQARRDIALELLQDVNHAGAVQIYGS